MNLHIKYSLIKKQVVKKSQLLSSTLSLEIELCKKQRVDTDECFQRSLITD